MSGPVAEESPMQPSTHTTLVQCSSWAGSFSIETSSGTAAAPRAFASE